MALALDQHLPGYVDAYFGPPDWREQAKTEGPRPLPELAQQASMLAVAILFRTSPGWPIIGILAVIGHGLRSILSARGYRCGDRAQSAPGRVTQLVQIASAQGPIAGPRV